MITQLDALRKAAFEVAKKVNGTKSPFHLTIISNENYTHHSAPFEEEHYCYLVVQAGSPDKFVNVPGYRAYAQIMLQFCTEREEFILEENSKPVNGFYTASVVTVNPMTLVDDFTKRVERFVRGISPAGMKII